MIRLDIWSSLHVMSLFCRCDYYYQYRVTNGACLFPKEGPRHSGRLTCGLSLPVAAVQISDVTVDHRLVG